MAREIQRDRAARRLEGRRAALAAIAYATGGMDSAVATARARVEHAATVVEAERDMELRRLGFTTGG